MKLEIKGLLTFDDLKNNSISLKKTIEINNYGIIIEESVGRYVIFDINYVENNLELKDSTYTMPKKEKSLSLVEAMIKTLDDLPLKKSTALALADLVEVYYGRKTTPVIVRNRAEENANGRNEIDYFYIEPGNYIGLINGVTFDTYMIDKISRGIEYILEKLLKKYPKLKINLALSEIRIGLRSSIYYDYNINFGDNDYLIIIEKINKYEIINNDYIRKKKDYHK